MVLHHYFMLYLILFLFSAISFTYYILNSYSSIYYREERTEGEKIDLSRVTIAIPVYNENIATFKHVIKSVADQGAKFLVLGDSSNEPYRSITEEYGGRFILSAQRMGKRNALALLLKEIETEYVMFVDSDTVIPSGTLNSMLSHMDENVGGVGTNIAVTNNESPVAYSAEFLERAREVVFRAMSHHGNVMVLDGRCVLYKTAVVKPYITSESFRKNKVLGRKSVMGDDRQITSYITKSGFKAIKDYGTTVYTDPPDDYKKFLRQQVRWQRVGWTHFFKELFNGTARKAGKFYTFELIYMYLLPVSVVLLAIFRLYVEFSVHRGVAIDALSEIQDLLLIGKLHNAIVSFTRSLLIILNVAGNAIFLGTIAIKINRKRIKTIAFGSIALAIMFATTLYGLVTFWKQDSWMTR